MSRFSTQATHQGGLLAAKLQPPPLPAKQLARPRLLDTITDNPKPFLLLEAPTGYGKTLLIQQWLAHHQAAFCWLNLDAKDSDIQRFALYLIMALRQLPGTSPDLGESCLKKFDQALTEGSGLDIEDGLLPLLAELNTQIKQPCWLVIDQAHWLNSPLPAALIECLLDNRPDQLRFILAGQKQPAIKLAHLQLQDQLLLLNARDLAFTPLETSRFCQTIHPEITWREKAQIHQKTQGWPAALKLDEQQLTRWMENEGLVHPPGQKTDASVSTWTLPVWPHPEQPSEKAVADLLTRFASLHETEITAQLQTLHQLTWNHCLLGQPKAARGYNREARELAAAQSNTELLAWLDLDLAFLEIHKGHLQLARKHLSSQRLNSPDLSLELQAMQQLLAAKTSWHQGELDHCLELLNTTLLLSGDSHPETFMQGLLLLAAVLIHQRHTSSAFTTLDEAEQLILTEKLIDRGWQAAITLLKTRLWLQEGKQELALTWLAQLSNQFPARTPVQLEVHLAYSQALLLNHKPGSALKIIESLLNKPSDYPAAPTCLHLKVQYALALAANRQKTPALDQLQETLLVAEPDQHRLPFLIDNTRLEPLLDEVIELLAPGSDLLHFATSLQASGQQPGSRLFLPLIDKLSSREQEVLLLVAEGLSNQEIGRRLFISLHTVKSHLKHLMKKLGVRSRTQAVTRARELRLL
ncbi:LuxR C-terminal-related transcriptional regulator [Marinospirillum sp.]|uniref:helix-turn-helix transcriptional regulator n=1 Tax=Marinospirillum sp. TaxID=2183934 RepID=UPI00384FCAD4